MPCSCASPGSAPFPSLPALACVVSLPARLSPLCRHRELLSEPLPVTDPREGAGQRQDNGPHSVLRGAGSQQGTGPSPLPSTGFSYLCWPLARAGDECTDRVVSLVNPPRVGWQLVHQCWGAAQPPNACMGAQCLPEHPSFPSCRGSGGRKMPQIKEMRVCPDSLDNNRWCCPSKGQIQDF